MLSVVSWSLIKEAVVSVWSIATSVIYVIAKRIYHQFVSGVGKKTLLRSRRTRLKWLSALLKANLYTVRASFHHTFSQSQLVTPGMLSSSLVSNPFCCKIGCYCFAFVISNSRFFFLQVQSPCSTLLTTINTVLRLPSTTRRSKCLLICDWAELLHRRKKWKTFITTFLLFLYSLSLPFLFSP